MAERAPVERLEKVWVGQTGGVREQALLAAFLFATVGGAYVARVGTSWARALAILALAVVLAAYVALLVRRRREARDDVRILRRVLFATDRGIAVRALRALRLVQRAEVDQTVGSAELALAHFGRVVDGVTNDSLKVAGARYAQRFRGVTLALLSVVLISVLVGPGRVVEGLDVLAARHGRAPLTMSWIGFPRVSALPPSYTRAGERSLVFGTTVELPKGTVITVRGVPRVPERPLVFTDGQKEQPFESDGAGGIVVRWAVRENASLRVAARFGDVRVDDEESLEVEVVPDERPHVEVEEAPKTVKLGEVSQIDVKWSARDDHGLREVDLVMRSGAREERRVLGRFDGESRIEHGGYSVLARDAFLRRMFLPIVVTVEAKDNDPLDGPKWSASPAITVIPPGVGEAEAERFAALTRVRAALVGLLEAFGTDGGASPRELRTRFDEVRAETSAALSASYAGSPVPRGFRAFVEGQLEKLSKTRGPIPERGVEDGVLAVDVALAALGNRDAADVAKRLADVAEEAALSARFGRETERRDEAILKLDQSLGVLEKGAERLATLSALGRDVGSVARADTSRIRRARTASDLLHAELAALHLAERLRRPTPSFGATTGHGRGGGGVESGRGRGKAGGEAAGPPPSSADSEFDRSAGAVSELAAEHQNALQGVESALEAASKAEPSEAEQSEAHRKAESLRKAVEALPLPGQEFGTPRAAAALAREHAVAAAHDLDDFALEQAKENATRSLQALDEAEHRLDPSDPVREEFERARKALRDARDFAEERLESRRTAAEARARRALEQAADIERHLGSRADEIARSQGDHEGALPKETSDRLEQAASVMREAAKELSEGHGEAAVKLQREAQRLLEQSRVGRVAERDPEEESPSRGEERGKSRSPGERSDDGKDVALGGDVPGPDDAARAEEFRRRVLNGLGRERSERLSPAVRRYAEGLLR